MSMQGVLEAPPLSSLPVTPCRASSMLAVTTTTNVDIETSLKNGKIALEVPPFPPLIAAKGQQQQSLQQSKRKETDGLNISGMTQKLLSYN